MTNLVSYIFVNSYSSFSPALNLTAAASSVGGDGSSAIVSIFGVATPFVMLAVVIFIIAAEWKVFAKAGKPGWASIVPIYNTVVLLQIAGKPIWWIILFFIPFVNIIAAIVVIHALSKAFGKGAGFTIGLLVLPFIFIPILGFGKAVYGAISPVTTSMPPAVPQM